MSHVWFEMPVRSGREGSFPGGLGQRSAFTRAPRQSSCYRSAATADAGVFLPDPFRDSRTAWDSRLMSARHSCVTLQGNGTPTRTSRRDMPSRLRPRARRREKDVSRGRRAAGRLFPFLFRLGQAVLHATRCGQPSRIRRTTLLARGEPGTLVRRRDPARRASGHTRWHSSFTLGCHGALMEMPRGVARGREVDPFEAHTMHGTDQVVSSATAKHAA